MFDFIADGITVGLAAGFTQLVGYILYWKLVVTADGKLPNPLTWLMFGYGTFILTILEWDVGATLNELYLPMVCAACGIGVAGRIWVISYKVTKNRWPKEWTLKNSDLWDGMSLSIDIMLTIGYVVAWVMFVFGGLTDSGKVLAMLFFLFCSNISTIFNFVPILRDTRSHPGHEHWLPWAIWTLSYTLLAVETWGREGVIFPTSWNLNSWDSSFMDWIWLLIYPASNLLFHGIVALLALPGRQKKMAREQPCE